MSLFFKRLVPTFIQRRLHGRLLLQKTLLNTSWLIADRILRLGIGMVISVWVTRYLGATQFGTLNFAIALIALFSPFANLGLDSIIIRNIIRGQTRTSDMLGTATILKFAGAILMNILGLLIVWVLRPTDITTRWLVLILSSATIFQSLDGIDLWFQSQLQSKYSIIAKLVALLLATGLRILLIWQSASVLMFALVSLIECVTGIVVSIFIYHLKGKYIHRWRVSWPIARNLLRDSLPLMFSGIAIGIYMKIDQVMLGNLRGDYEVGIYSAAVRLSELWYFIPLAIVSSTFPSIVSTKQISEELYLTRLKKLFILVAGLSYVVAIPMTFFSGFLITWLYGSAFSEAGPVLAIHIWASLAVFLGVARESWMTTEGLMQMSFVITLSGAVCNIALNLWLIPPLGAIGAAIATVISYFFVVFIFPLFIPRMRFIEKMLWHSLILK